MPDTITLNEFFRGDELKIDVFKSKYLNHPEETVAECFERICSEISNVCNDSNELTQQWVQELLADEWRPGGSITAGVNKKDKKISLFNCTHLPLSGDSLEEIYKTRYSVAKAAAYRQGVGIDFSALRPRGTKIGNSAEISEGAIHWMKSFDRLGEEVGQLGRRPAILGSLKINHPDIEEFICAKDDVNKLQNMNISVQITDDFMHAVKENLDWVMHYKVESSGEEVTKIVRARDLFRKICDHAWISGDPGVQYIDLMNRFSIQKSLNYNIIGTNACSEKPLPAYGVCGLASLNMGKVPHLNELDEFKSYIERKATSMVRFMDNVVEYELRHKYKSPLDEQYKVVDDLREIGLGITNLHKWLFDQGLEYDSNEGIYAIEYFFRYYMYYSFKASCELAKEKSPCPAWLRLRDSIGIDGMKRNQSEFLTNLFQEFPDLEMMYYTYGIRNGALLSIAPTGTLSMTFASDILSSGIEPIIGAFYWRRTRAVSKGEWDYYFVISRAVKNIILRMIGDKDLNDYRAIESLPGSILDNDGSKGEAIIAIIKKYLDKRLLKNAFEIDPFKKIELISRVQRYVDAAISVTFNVKNEFTKEDTEKLYMQAYDNKIKAMTIFRDGVREGIMFFEFPKNKKPKLDIQVEPETRPTDIEYIFAPERPKTLPCDIYKVMGHSVIVGLLVDKPYEMFIIENGLKLPETGFITKIRNKKYRLTDASDMTLVENLIDDQVANEKIQAITRLTSASLRHGVPIDFICEQLSKCGDSISSYPKMLGRVLKRYKFLVLESTTSDERCPTCGEPLVSTGGCFECVNCTFTKCE
jgi:ribonucleoside-diphosphate reductase alpha chain